jgi:glyoxylate reductase
VIAVSSALPGRALEIIGEAATVRGGVAEEKLAAEELATLVEGAEVLVTLVHDRVDAALLDRAPELRCICNVAVGVDNIDLEAAAARGIAVTNTPAVLDDATADMTMAIMLAVTRRVAEGDRLLRSGKPWSWGIEFMLGTDLRDKRLGVVGLGAIGGKVAERARAFGMTIGYSGRSESPHAAALGGTREELPDLLRHSDVVTLHCPLTAETRGLIGAEEFAAMGPGAYLINASRGPVVDEAALVDALVAGEIAGAGLDVFEHEPKVHPGLFGMNNVVLVPHLGSATVETRAAMSELAARNAVAAIAGDPLVTPIPLPPLDRIGVVN